MTTMDELGDQLIEAITGNADYDEPDDPIDLVHELRQEYGSLVRAAKEIGVDRRTLQRWEATGGGRRTSKPKHETEAKVRAAVRRLISERPRDQLSDTKVLLETTDKDVRRRKPRQINGRQLNLQPGTMARVEAAFRRGEDAGTIGRIFVAGVRTQFYRAYLAADDRDSDLADSDYGAATINVLTV